MQGTLDRDSFMEMNSFIQVYLYTRTPVLENILAQNFHQIVKFLMLCVEGGPVSRQLSIQDSIFVSL